MTTKPPLFLDLDATDPDSVEVVVKLGGIEHHLVPMTVDSFIANIQSIEKLSVGKTSAIDEFELTCEMLIRSFPTMNREMLGSLPLEKIQAMHDFAQKHNGFNKVKDAAEEDAASGN